jgi:hypothetical protein
MTGDSTPTSPTSCTVRVPRTGAEVFTMPIPAFTTPIPAFTMPIPAFTMPI